MAKKKKIRRSKPLQQQSNRLAHTAESSQPEGLRGLISLQRIDIIFILIAIFVPFLAYLPSLSAHVLLEVVGVFLGAGYHLGLAHPPGYPVYTLLVWVFMQLPFATPALAGHVLSALLSAFACGALYACGRLIGLLPVAAILAA